MGPKSNDQCPYKKRERETTQREGEARTEAETGAMHREANAHEGTPAAPRNPERGRERMLPQSLEETSPAET